MTRPQFASEPSDTLDGVQVPEMAVEGALLLRTEQQSMRQPAGPRSELRRLTWGPGVRSALIDTRLGPHLRAAWDIAPDASPLTISAVASQHLRALSARLPGNLPTAALTAFGLHPDVQDHSLERRTLWLASRLDRDPRTARRRIDTAIDLLARDITEAPIADVVVPYRLLGDLLRVAPPQLVDHARRVLGQSAINHASACATPDKPAGPIPAAGPIPSPLPPEEVTRLRRLVGITEAGQP
jgi:hypothetical protein